MEKEKVIEALKQVNDPEINLNVWFLGLIYDISIDSNNVKIKMTFTTPFCPYGPALVAEVERTVKEAGADSVSVEVVFEPKWEPSEEVKMALGV